MLIFQGVNSINFILSQAEIPIKDCSDMSKGETNSSCLNTTKVSAVTLKAAPKSASVLSFRVRSYQFFMFASFPQGVLFSSKDAP